MSENAEMVMSAVLVEITFDAQRTKRVFMQFADSAGPRQPAQKRKKDLRSQLTNEDFVCLLTEA